MSIANDSLTAKGICSSVHDFARLETHRTKGSFVVQQDKGIYVCDADGNRYIDSPDNDIQGTRALTW